MSRTRAVEKPIVTPTQKLPDAPILPPPSIVTKRVTRSFENREITLPSPDGVRAYACGEQWLGGKVQYVFYPGTLDDLWYVVELCAGECDALLDVSNPERPGVIAHAAWWWYPGTDAGAVDSHLQAVDASWSEAFAGTCYAIVHLTEFSTYWQGQIPNFLWHMRTRKVLCPDTGVRAYSTNVWDQWYDYVRWSEGKALPLARVDAAAFAAAKAADAAAGRDCAVHMLLLDATDPSDVISSFTLLASAWWFWDDLANRYTVVPDRAGAAVAATYDDHHGLRAASVSGAGQDTFERPNKVTVWCTDLTNKRTLIPISVQTHAVDIGSADPIEEEHRLPWLYSPTRARSIAMYILNSFQFDLQIQDEWNALTAARRLGDVVTLNIPARARSFTGRLMQRSRLPSGTFKVTLLEHNEAKFSDAVVDIPAKTPSTRPDPPIYTTTEDAAAAAPVQSVVGAIGDVTLADILGAGAESAVHAAGTYETIVHAAGTYETAVHAAATYAAIASPVFTGVPAAPTAAGGTNTTQIATTAFVHSEAPGLAPVQSVFGRTGAVVPTTGDYGVAQVTGAESSAHAAATYVPLARSIATTAPLAGGGDLTANRTLSIAITPTANGGAVALQATTPGTQQVGSLNLLGSGVFDGSVRTRHTYDAYSLTGAVTAFFDANDATAASRLYVATAHPLNIYTSAALRMVVRATGEVGIGTSTAAAKLAINGGLHVGGDSDPGNDNLLADGWVRTSSSFSAAGGFAALPPTDAGLVYLYRTSGAGTTYPFNEAGHLVLQSRNVDSRGVLFVTGATSAVSAVVNNVGIGVKCTPSAFPLESAGHVGPNAQTTYDLGSPYTKWRSLFAAELQVETLVAQNTIATIGGRILVGPTTKLTADVAAAGTSITVENNEMAVGDRIYLETAPGGVQQTEYMAVTAGPTGTGPYVYTVTRNLDGTGANDWQAGDAVFNTGAAGDGFIDLYSVHGVKGVSEYGPTIVGNVRASAAFNDYGPRWAIGNLNGLYGYLTTTYGAAFGVPTAAWIKIDPSSGVRIGHNTTVFAQVDASGAASFTGSVTVTGGNAATTTYVDTGLSGKIASGGAAADVNANVTTISGGKITAATITTAQLNFTPVQTSNVVASINASAEGIQISGARIAISGSTTFAAGYDPTGKIASGGAAADVNANVTTISGGKITAATITATQLNVAQLSAIAADMGAVTAGSIVIGSTNKVWLNDAADGALNIGGATKASAPFHVTAAGALTATNATITGTITATSGTFGGFTATAGELYAGSGSTRVEMQAAGGFWAGATAFVNAPFSVSPAGVLTAASGTIGGLTITGSNLSLGYGIYGSAYTPFYVDSSGQFSLGDKFLWNGATGTIGGWTIGNSTLSAGGMVLNSGYPKITFTAGIDMYVNGELLVVSDSLYSVGSLIAGKDNGAARVMLNGSLGTIVIGTDKVLGARGAAVAHADGTLASATAQLNALIDRFSAAAGGHGAIA